MKTAFVILSAIFVAVASSEVSTKITETITDCASTHNLDRKAVVAQLNENAIPEDDAEFTKFFTCFSTKLETADNDGNVNAAKLEEVLATMLKQKLGDVPDIDAKVRHIASEAIEHCKDTPKADSVGLSLIKMRNCIKAYTQRTQHH